MKTWNEQTRQLVIQYTEYSFVARHRAMKYYKGSMQIGDFWGN